MRARKWLRSLRERTVKGQSDAPIRRRPSDAARVFISITLVTGLAFHAHHPSAWERAFLRMFETLPQGPNSLVLLAYNLLALWAVALLAVAVLLVRRWRLARDLVVATSSAWVVGRVVAFFVQKTDLWKSFQVTFDLADAPRFPLVRVAVAVAAIVVASPHLSRPFRRVGQGIVLTLVLGTMYVGRGSPTDLLGAFVLGWGVAAAVHLAFGTLDGRPGTRQVAAALVELRIAAWNLRLDDDQPVARAVFLAEDSEGPLSIAALGRDEADAQFLVRLGRFLAFRDAPAMLLPTRRQQIEYEAYIHLLARDAGARVPELVFVGSTRALALLIEREPPGSILADLEPAEITTRLLADVWAQLAALRTARIVHGKLDAHHVVVDAGVPTLVGFEYASTGDDQYRAAADVAQVLAATAPLVGPSLAATVAVDKLGPEVIGAALPILQPKALSGWTQDALAAAGPLDEKLQELRDAAASLAGTEPPELRRLYRVEPRTLLLAVGALAGVGALLSRVGDPGHFWNEIQGANWAYVALAVLLATLADVVFGITFLGNVPIRIPVWPSIELQGALSFSNLAVPVAADAALQVRFLQKNGMDLPSATATGGVLSSLSEIAVQLGLFVIALRLAPTAIRFGRIDTAKLEIVGMIVIFAVGVVVAVIFSLRQIRRLVLPPLLRALRTVWDAIKTPGRLALLVGGNALAQVIYAGALLACLAAFGASVDFWTLVALNIGVSTIASLVPIPGGGTAVKAVGLAGMLTAFGVPRAAGAAAVLVNQVAVSYLPAIPGWFAMNDLIRRRLL